VPAVVIERDPFTPIVEEPPYSSTPSRGGPLPPVPPLVPGMPVPPAPAGPPPNPGAGFAVSGIVGENPWVAIVLVGGKSYIVGVGDNVRDAVVVSITQTTVALRRGDATFTLSVESGSTP